MSLRVLHVVDVFSAGVATAMMEYTRSTPEITHHLVCRVPQAVLDDTDRTRFASVTTLSEGGHADLERLRATIATLGPDVVHAHSSLAGAVLRGALQRRHRPYRLVYTPHCYAFERRDVSPPVRRAFWLVEAALARGADVVAACSRREARLARSLHRRGRVVVVPNIAEEHDPSGGDRRDPNLVVGLGRLSPQKDPDFFAAAIGALRTGRPELTAQWIGGGDAAFMERLSSEHVHVTGWVAKSEAMKRLGTAAVYMHSATWEGEPMALLEAHSLGVPIVARAIPALCDAPPEALATTPRELAERARMVLSSPEQADRNVAAWHRYFRDNTRDGQRRALLEAYGG